MDRRTLRKIDPIIGDEPVRTYFDGRWTWQIWETKKGCLVARYKFDDGEGYQIEADDMNELRIKIRGFMSRVSEINRSVGL